MKRIRLVTTDSLTRVSHRVRRNMRETAGHYVEAFVELVIGNRQRRQKPQDVPKCSSRHQENAAGGRHADDFVSFVLRGFFGRAVAYEPDRYPRSAAPDIANHRVVFCPRTGARLGSHSDRLAA